MVALSQLNDDACKEYPTLTPGIRTIKTFTQYKN